MLENIAVLVLSCDKYSNLWSGFFECFERHFPKNYCSVYLGTNTKGYESENVIPVFSGKDLDWSSSYYKILEQIPEKKIFVILEDIFLSSTVEKDTLDMLFEFSLKMDCKLIRYWASPAPDTKSDSPILGILERGAPYRATVCGIWDREFLQRMLLQGENPWNFEIMGSYRTSYSDGFYSTYEPLCSYKNMVEKGHWIESSYQWAVKNNISIKSDLWPHYPFRSGFVSNIKVFIYKIILKIDWRLRLRFCNFVRRLLACY